MKNLQKNIYIKVALYQLPLRKTLLVRFDIQLLVQKLDWQDGIHAIQGTTKVKMAAGQNESEGKLPEFVERRRAALERYLLRTATHPIFQVDPDFREFLECGKSNFNLNARYFFFSNTFFALWTEEELPRASSTSALSGAGVLRLFNRMGETVTKIAFKMGESDPVITNSYLVYTVSL